MDGNESTSDCKCKKMWEDLDDDLQKIIDIKEPIARNKIFNAKYAELFQRNNNLAFSGAASFGSKDVGCALVMIRRIMRTTFASVHGPGSVAMAFLLKARLSAFYERLAAGNQAVFSEIFGTMEFYDRFGFTCLRKCAEERKPKPVPPSLVDAFRNIEDPGKTKDGVLKGALEILKHEQSVTLHRTMYSIPEQAQNFRVASMLKGTPWGINAIFSSECDGRLQLPFLGRDISNLSERLPYMQDVVTAFWQIYAEDPAFINEQLDNIIGNSGR